MSKKNDILLNSLTRAVEALGGRLDNPTTQEKEGFRTVYTAGCNMPGCLADEPYEWFDTWQDAWEYVRDLAEQAADYDLAVLDDPDPEYVTDSEQEIASMLAEFHAIRRDAPGLPFAIYFDDMVYCVDVIQTHLPTAQCSKQKVNP